ncbi:MAG: hypothetical protein ABJN40_13065 [Sneathiella sp.]
MKLEIQELANDLNLSDVELKLFAIWVAEEIINRKIDNEFRDDQVEKRIQTILRILHDTPILENEIQKAYKNNDDFKKYFKEIVMAILK